MDREWVKPAIAARKLGYSPRYFTRYVLQTLHHRKELGPNGGPRYWVERHSLEQAVIAQGIK